MGSKEPESRLQIEFIFSFTQTSRPVKPSPNNPRTQSSTPHLQLIGARKPLGAVGPGADEGAVARVPAEVRPEVAGLAVGLVAAGDVADVLALPQAPRGRGDLPPVRVGAPVSAVGTGARHPAGHSKGTTHQLTSGNIWPFYH